MEHRGDQPRPRPEPPPLDGSKEALEYLLKVEQERLETAVRIERERQIVFPETSIIIRDIQKLMDALGRHEEAVTVGVEAQEEPDELDSLLRAVGGV